MSYHEVTGDAIQRGTLVLRNDTNEFRTESQSLDGEMRCTCGESFRSITAAKQHLRDVDVE